MSKKVSIKDIAKEAGVSPCLVSFVLNGKEKKYRISDQVAEKVRATIKKMDYKPNGFAKSLREGTNHTIGVIVSDISNPFFSSMVKNIELAAEESGYMALFASSDENADKLSYLLDQMLGKEVAGLIIVPCEGSEKAVKSIIDKNIPTVLLDRYIPEIKTNRVCLDNRKAGFTATSTLIERGIKKIAFICYGMNITNIKGRICGYEEAMTKNGLSDEILIRHIDINDIDNTCATAMDDVVEQGYDAIVCATNSITVSCLRYIQKNNLRIPEDYVVMGFDGGYEFEFFNSPLLFLTQPIEAIARKSVEILIGLLTSNDSTLVQEEIEGTVVEQIPGS